MHAVRYFCDGVCSAEVYDTKTIVTSDKLMNTCEGGVVWKTGRWWVNSLSLSLSEPAREVRQKLEDAFHPPARSWGEWWLHCSRPFSHSYSRKTLPSAESTALAVTLKPCLVYLPIVSAPSAHFICTHSGRDVDTRWFTAFQNIVVWHYTGF